jgi:ABC-type dipeptide/oligopeptide/nickel transport system permease subunit
MTSLAPLSGTRTRLPAPRVNRTFLTGAALLGGIIALCVVGPLLISTSTTGFGGLPLSGPSFAHPFGTDAFGRDVFIRVLVGGRIDLGVAFIGVTVPLLVGTVIGIASGLVAGSLLDRVIMRTVDAILAFPFNILILALAVVLGQSTTFWILPAGVPGILVALFLTSWSVYARIARGETLSLRQRDFLVAARVSGLSWWTIVRRHIFPNVLPATLTYALSDAVLVIGVIAALPFLGAGVQPPTPEWGSIIYDGRSVLSEAPWVCFGPGLFIVCTGIAVRLMGQGSRVLNEDVK